MKRYVHSVLRRFGYRIVRIDNEPKASAGTYTLFAALQRLGFVPQHIVDVGANHGVWSRAAFGFFPAAYYTLVDPQDDLKIHVQDLVDRGARIRWINAGAADKVGSLPFTVANRDDSSTFSLPTEATHRAGLCQITVPVTTLNAIAASSDVPLPDMVKIDAEGFDLKVLNGASSLFGKTEIFLVEASACCDYPNSVAEIVRFMSAVGYRLIDITDLNRSPRHGVLWLCELVFLRNSSRLLDSVTSYE